MLRFWLVRLWMAGARLIAVTWFLVTGRTLRGGGGNFRLLAR